MALVLVTGASGGLGRATVTELATQGHDVVVHARPSARVAASASGGQCAGVVVGDLAETGEIPDVARQAAAFGRVRRGEQGTLDVAMSGEHVGSFASFASAPGTQWTFIEICESFGQPMANSRELPSHGDAPQQEPCRLRLQRGECPTA
ncbi:SDR family NAD(P)-dependent oxidoreductase [Streptomyces sp. NPDC001443]